ncbi:MAG TPA: hypothetical protein VII93_04790 [Anaerolineales bacterium]
MSQKVFFTSLMLVCPTGEVTSIWYHQSDSEANITRGGLEFGFIFTAPPTHCASGISLGSKDQHVGDLIIASPNVQ